MLFMGPKGQKRRCPVVPQLRTMHLAQSSSGEDIHRPLHYLEKLMALARLSEVQWMWEILEENMVLLKCYPQKMGFEFLTFYGNKHVFTPGWMSLLEIGGCTAI